MISLILLASGFSRRFGSNKLLYEINGKPMYLHTLEKLHRLSLHKIENHEIQILVISQYAQILDSVIQRNVYAIENRQAEEGIASSVRLGAAHSEESEWMFYFMGDQPYLKEDTIRSFIMATLNSDKTLSSVHTDGEPGNPTAFHKSWREALLRIKGDRGGRVIMKKNPDDVFWYEISSLERLDIDYL